MVLTLFVFENMLSESTLPSSKADRKKSLGASIYFQRGECNLNKINCEGLLSMDRGRTYQRVLKELNSVGGEGTYRIHAKLLNTADYGVRHNRPRVYFVGIRRDLKVHSFRWPARKKQGYCVDYLLQLLLSAKSTIR